MEKKDRSKLFAVIIVIAVIVVLTVSFITGKKSTKIDERKASIVTNASNFYTVNSCLYRVITYIEKNDTDSLLKTFNEEYKEKNNINEQNILQKLPKVEENSTFVSKKMYYQNINNNITRYYVYGQIKRNVLHDYTTIDDDVIGDAYFIIDLDSSNQTFAIQPYKGKLFIGGENSEKK